MKLLLLLFFILVSFTSFASNKVKIKTNYGVIEIELNKKKAPKSVKNF